MSKDLNDSETLTVETAVSTLLTAVLLVLYCYVLIKKVYPKVSGLAAWRENCKWYSSLPLGAVVSLFSESV
jgi:hypothetical protein